MSKRCDGRDASRVRIALAAGGAVGLVLAGVPSGFGPAGGVARAEEVVFQAESFTSETDLNGGVIDIFGIGTDDANASPPANPRYITPNANSTAGAPQGVLTYPLTLSTPNTDYYLYARFRLAGGTGDSFFVPNRASLAANATPALTTFDVVNNLQVVPGSTSGNYVWVNLHAAPAGVDAVAETYQVPAAGNYNFFVGNREANLRLDAFVLSNNNGLAIEQLNPLVGLAPPPPLPDPLPAGQFIPGPQGGLGTWGVREVTNARVGFTDDVPINRLEKANQAVQDTEARRVEYQTPRINIYDSDQHGHFPAERPFRSARPPGPLSGQVDNIAMLATGTIRVPAGGPLTYTLGVNSDDGFRMTVLNPANGQTLPFTTVTNGANNNGTMEFNTGRGAADTLGQIDFPAPGDYPIQVLYFEGNGGSSIEVFSSPGAKTAFDGEFGLIGGQAETVTRRFGQVGGWNTYTFGGLSGMAATIAAYNNGNPAAGVVRSNTTETTIAFNDPGEPNNGSHGADARPYPGDTDGAPTDNFSTGARAPLTITNPGRYTIAVYSDDGFRFRILDQVGNPVTGIPVTNTDLVDSNGDSVLDALRPIGNDNGCCVDFIGGYDLPAGTYTMEVISNEMGGGAGLFVYGAEGDYGVFDPFTFQLLGANVTDSMTFPAGLQLVPEPTSAGLLGLAALGLLARRRRKA